MNSKILTESGWKATAEKCKVKDNGLQRALSAYEKLDDDEHDDRLKAIASVSQLAGALKKVKEVTAVPEVVKYLTDLISVTQSEEAEITKAKLLAEKAQALGAKAEADAKKLQPEEDPDEEEEAGDYRENLKAAFKRLKGSKELVYNFIVCDAKPQCGFIMSKQRINAKHRAELTEVTGGSKQFLKAGTCRVDGGILLFEMEKAPQGLAGKLKKSFKYFTEIPVRVMVGDQSDDDDGEPLSNAINPDLRASENPSQPAGTPKPNQPTSGPPQGGTAGAAASTSQAKGPLSLGASVGRGGKNKPEDVTAVQTALNTRTKADLTVDGKCASDTIQAIEVFQKLLGQFKPDGLVEPGRGTARALASTAKLGPPPEPPQPVAPPKLGKATLTQAPIVWHSTRNILNTNIEELKKGVRAEYGPEDPKLFRQIDESMVKLTGILGRLDTRLADSLEKANAAGNDAARNVELKNSKTILTDYIKYVKSEPLIAHMDSNPFGVKTNLKKVLTDSLTHMAQAIG